jgi:hypothetical protein
MSTAPHLTFDQAIQHLRRGFIVRIHGHDKYQGALLQEDEGKLQLSFGDSNWQSAADVPVIDLTYDVYDQKKPKPEVQKLENAEPLLPFKVGDRVRYKDDSDNTVGIVREIEPDGLVTVHFDDSDEDDGNELHEASDLVLDTSTELGGGNSPAAPPADGVGSVPDTLGTNESQVDAGTVHVSHPATGGHETEGDPEAEPMGDQSVVYTEKDGEDD